MVKPSGGADPCRLNALPQSFLSTIAVMVATAEGTWRPAAMPMTNRAIFNTAKFDANDNASRGNPKTNVETNNVPLWLIRDVRKPEISWAMHNPIDIIKNKDPAWVCEMPKSCSMVGINGANISGNKPDNQTDDRGQNGDAQSDSQ